MSVRDLPVVNVEDLVDWAYCPLRVWWKRSAAPGRDQGQVQTRTGEQLARTSMHTTIKAFYKAASIGEPVPFSRLVEYTWDRELSRCGLKDLKSKLVEYSERKSALLDTASRENTPSVTEDGERLFPVAASRQWGSALANSGLYTLRKTIDQHQAKAGLRAILKSDDDLFVGPVGLADAYATCMLAARQLEKDLPPVERFAGAGVPVSIDLLSVRLVATADIVLRLGGETLKKGGRPANKEFPRELLQYEMHLYDHFQPPSNGFVRDIRLMTLRQSLPEDRSPDLTTVKTVLVRLLQTGATQEFSAVGGADVDVLDALAKAFLVGQTAGVYIPRMMAGGDLCEGCAYRANCFSSGSDVMRDINPPLSTYLQAKVEDVSQLEELIADIHSSGDNSVSGIMLRLLDWMRGSPDLTAEDATNMVNLIVERSGG